MLDAAVASILDHGYYETSSNAIARRAGVTWGALQHQFGSREALMLEVLNDGWARLHQTLLDAGPLRGATLEERLTEVVEVLGRYYGVGEHLAHLQIMLDLVHNPNTSDETRAAASAHGRTLSRAWQPLFSQALGVAAEESDLVGFAFQALRGYLLGTLISSRANDAALRRPHLDLLVRGVAHSIRSEAAGRGIELP